MSFDGNAAGNASLERTAIPPTDSACRCYAFFCKIFFSYPHLAWLEGASSPGNHGLFGVMNATAAPLVSTAMPILPTPGMSCGGVTTSPPKAAAFCAVRSQSGTAT